MVTNQIMKRGFMESQISQRTKDGFFNATELLAIYNSVAETKKTLDDFWINKNVKDFLKEVEQDINLNTQNSLHLNTQDSGYLKTHETTRGRGGATWMHPYLFVKFAMWLSPKFELQIIKWVYDNLIEMRNQAGDHFKEMCEAIGKAYFRYYRQQANPIVFIKEAKFLNNLCYNSFDGGKRNELSEKQLSLLNALQKLNIKLINSYRYGKEERHKKLTEFASNYKMIEF